MKTVLRGIGWSLKSVEKYEEGYQGYGVENNTQK
jgi:hypothetical protein